MLRVHALFADPITVPRTLRAADAQRCSVFHRTPEQLTGLEVPAVGTAHEMVDPFDRLIAAQALVEAIRVVSIDTVLDLYGVDRIW